MKQSIAQIVALVNYGNHFILHFDEPLNQIPFTLEHSTVQFHSAIEFHRKHSMDGDKVSENLAANPRLWFELLVARNLSGLVLHYAHSKNDVEDWELAGMVGGGGRWLIEAFKDDGSDIWEAKQSVVDEGGEKSSMKTVYYLIAEDYPSRLADTSPLNATKKELERSLTIMKEFAINNNLTDFVNKFDQAITILHAENPLVDVYHKDLLPVSDHNHQVLQILSSCQYAWVFGVAWADHSFIDQEIQTSYQMKSMDHFDIVNDAIVNAVNQLYFG